MGGPAGVFGLFESEDEAGEVEVARVGDFQVRGVGFEHKDGFAEAFDEGGVVGAGEIVLLIGPPEEVGLEDLRGLDGDELGAVEGAFNGAGGEVGLAGSAEDGVERVFGRFGRGLRGDLLDGVGQGAAGDDGGVAMVEDGREEAVDEGRRGAWAGRVVDGDDGGGVCDMFKGGLDALPAVLGATGADGAAEEGEAVGVAELEFVECAGFVVRAGDDDLVDARVVGEELDGALEDGASAEVLIELVLLAETGGRSGGRDDDADAHGGMIGDLGPRFGGWGYHRGMTDPSPASPDYLAPYADAVRAHGASFEATLWASKEKQVGRFAVIAEMADLTGRVIVDAGCGLGDLAAYCEEQGIGYGKYIGLEAMPDMVAAAAKRELPEARFEDSDFAADPEVFGRLAKSDRFDVAVFSGSLNTFEPDAAFEVVRRAFRAAQEGVVFNFLSAKNHERNPINPAPAKRFEPSAMLERVLGLTPRVRFRQDYFDGHDGTIALFHSDRAETRK